METEEVSDRFVAPCFVNELEAYDGEINLGVEENMISNEYAVKLCLEHEVKRGNKVVKKELIVALRETKEEGKSNDDWDHLLDFNIDDIPLLGEEGLPPFVCKMGKSSRNKKRATENLNFFYQDMGTSSSAGRDDMKKVGVTTLLAKFLILDIPIDRDSPIVVGHGFFRTIGAIFNTPERLFSTFDGFCHQTFRAARSYFMRNAESDSDDEEEYQIKRNKFGAPIYGPNPAPYLNCNDPDERSLAIQTTMGTNDEEAGSSRSKRSRHETVEEVLLPQVHHEFLLWEGCNKDTKSRYNTRLAQLLPRHIYSPYIVNWDVLNRMDYDGENDDMLRIKFDEVCADDELQTKKIIKFRLGGRGHNLTLLEFARRLGLYQAVELEEDGFNVYFEGGLRNDDNLNAQDYWLSISREDNLSLSRSYTSTIRRPILRLIYKMITYDMCQRTTGKCMVLTEDVVWSLSAPVYCRDLDTTTLRDLIDSDGKLIPEDPQPAGCT
ncbi:hypothetical protein Tco_0777621 [Tanacetum coccineum]